MVASDPHRAGEELPGLEVRGHCRQLPHRRGLGDRHIVEHAEAGDEDRADDEIGHRQIRGVREQEPVLGVGDAQARPRGHPRPEDTGEDDAEHRAEQCRRRPRRDAVREIEGDEHDRTRRDHGHEHRGFAVEDRGEHEHQQHDSGEAEADQRSQTTETGDDEDDDSVDDRQGENRHIAVIVDEDEVRTGLGAVRRFGEIEDFDYVADADPGLDRIGSHVQASLVAVCFGLEGHAVGLEHRIRLTGPTVRGVHRGDSRLRVGDALGRVRRRSPAWQVLVRPVRPQQEEPDDRGQDQRDQAHDHDQTNPGRGTRFTVERHMHGGPSISG